MIIAMTELIAFLTVLLVAAGVLATFRDTHDDGYEIGRAHV